MLCAAASGSFVRESDASKQFKLNTLINPRYALTGAEMDSDTLGNRYLANLVLF